MSKLTNSSTWKALAKHQTQISKLQLCDLFSENPQRAKQLSLTAAGLFLDYAKNLITAETMQLLNKLVSDSQLVALRDAMFAGEAINNTEQRAVLHTALRETKPNAEIAAVLQKMAATVNKLRNSEWLGLSGKPITDVVNIGIGGSDLGPAMVTEALRPYQGRRLKLHFVSNVDGTQISETLNNLSPATTLFIVASKTFTTQETLCNALTAREWLLQACDTSEKIDQHLLAVTANPDRAQEFGITTDNIYPFWDWVGGRYSMWSAIGLPIAIAVGMDNFKELLAGAHAMDHHFKTADLNENMPVILALLGIWYNNFSASRSHAVIPYDQYLHLLPAYLQQLDMESNGKHINRDGEIIDYATAPIIWGTVGTNGQHAYHQLLHQGTQLIPIDFILSVKSHNPVGKHHTLLYANCLAQSRALMQGQTQNEIIKQLQDQGLSASQIKALAIHKDMPGNKPSNTILLEKLTPNTLGALIALYEHKVFTQGAIWNLNSFDQWGVELGKKIANSLLTNLELGKINADLDSSTKQLLKRWNN